MSSLCFQRFFKQLKFFKHLGDIKFNIIFLHFEVHFVFLRQAKCGEAYGCQNHRPHFENYTLHVFI